MAEGPGEREAQGSEPAQVMAAEAQGAGAVPVEREAPGLEREAVLGV